MFPVKLRLRMSAAFFMNRLCGIITKMDLDLSKLTGWLDTFLNFERSPNKKMLKLDAMRTLCDYFGNPQNDVPCIHVAGSKGKGTISAYIANVLQASGYKTGVYSSPHLHHFTERVGTGTGPFGKKIYDTAFKELRDGIDEIINKKIMSKDNITWFELVTLFAMLCFKKAKVDFAIYEVGLGGRLDATNIINPECIAMGPIEMEHTAILGDSLAKIAFEKAGVFKKGVPVVSAPQTAEAREVFIKEAKRVKVLELEFVPKANHNYQEIDAEIAKRIVRRIDPEITKEQADLAISNTYIPGRYEKISLGSTYKNIPYLLIDVAHTKNSIKQVLDRMKTDGVSGNLIFGCAIDKDVDSMAKEILEAGRFKTIFLTRPGDFKKSNLAMIEKAFVKHHVKIICSSDDYKDLIAWALKASNKEKLPVVVLGSFYLADEVLKILEL